MNAPPFSPSWPTAKEMAVSDTPRTDALAFNEFGNRGGRRLVAAEDMRNLERELAAANEALDSAKQSFLDICDEIIKQGKRAAQEEA